MLKAVEVEIKHKNAMKRREEALDSIFAKKMKPKPSLLLSLPSCLNPKLIMQRPLYACRDVDQKGMAGLFMVENEFLNLQIRM